MRFQYETDRLTLQLLRPDSISAKQTLRFYDKNRTVFEQYEAMRPENFYTEQFQKRMLSEEMKN